MKKVLALCAMAALAACGDDAPKPKPAAETPPPQAAAPAPAAATPAPEAKAPEAPKPDPNRELAQRVKQALEGDAKIQAAAIDVAAKDGRVSLFGTAGSAGERSRAGDIASKVEGVASVDNQIKIVKGS